MCLSSVRLHDWLVLAFCFLCDVTMSASFIQSTPFGFLRSSQDRWYPPKCVMACVVTLDL